MAKRTFSTLGLTWAPIALGLATANNYMALQPASATQVVDIDEVLISGTVGTGTVGAFVLSQLSSFCATPTPLSSPASDGPMVQGATPTIQTTYITAGTQPTIGSTATTPKLNLGLNMFGGIIRWNAAPTQQWTCTGSTAPGGGIVFNATAGTGASGTSNAHIIYEPY